MSAAIDMTQSAPKEPVLDAALARYFAIPAVGDWLTDPQPVLSVPADAMHYALVYAIAFGRDATTQAPIQATRRNMDVEDILIVTSITPERFAIGVVYGLAQAHVFAKTPLMSNAVPKTRRFAVDLNQTACLEFMEVLHFDNAMVSVNYRQFLHTPDGQLPVVVRSTLHTPGSARGVLGPIVMRAHIFEAVTCPVCRRDNYACCCPFEAKSRTLTSRVAIRSWHDFTSKFMRKARDGKIRMQMTAVVPALGEINVLTGDLDALNVIVQGQSDYMTLMRRKAVHGLGIVVSYPRADTPLAAPAEALDYLALHNQHVSREAARATPAAKRTAVADALQLLISMGDAEPVDEDALNAAFLIDAAGPKEDYVSCMSPGLGRGLESSSSATYSNRVEGRVVAAGEGDARAALATFDSTSFGNGSYLESAQQPQAADLPCMLQDSLAPEMEMNALVRGVATPSAPKFDVVGAGDVCEDVGVSNRYARTSQCPPGSSPNGSRQDAYDVSRSPSGAGSTSQPVDFHSGVDADSELDQLLSSVIHSGCSSVAADDRSLHHQEGNVDETQHVGDLHALLGAGSYEKSGSEDRRSTSGEIDAWTQSRVDATPASSRPRSVADVQTTEVIRAAKVSSSDPNRDEGALHQPSSSRRALETRTHLSSRIEQSHFPQAESLCAPQSTVEVSNIDPHVSSREGLKVTSDPPTFALGNVDVSAEIAAPVQTAPTTSTRGRPHAPSKRRRQMNPIESEDVRQSGQNSPVQGSDADRKHACSICPSRFKMRGDLQRHIKVVHEKKKMYTCETCGKAFGHSGHLNRHRQSHRGERRFKCDLCGFQFFQMSHLTSHIEHIHSASKGRHECSLCKLRVADVSELRAHLRSVHKLAGIKSPGTAAPEKCK